MSKLEDRIKWLQESEYDEEFKAKQIAGAIRSEETRLSVGPRPTNFLAPEAYWPEHNPNDLPVDYPDRNHYE